MDNERAFPHLHAYAKLATAGYDIVAAYYLVRFVQGFRPQPAIHGDLTLEQVTTLFESLGIDVELLRGKLVLEFDYLKPNEDETAA